MLEYDIAESDEFLVAKSQIAKDNLKMTDIVTDTIKEQITTIEVNMARIYISRLKLLYKH